MPASAFSVPGMSLANSLRNGYVWVPGGIPIASAGRRKAEAVNAAPPRKVLRARVDMRQNFITPAPLLLFLLRERLCRHIVSNVAMALRDHEVSDNSAD